MKRINYKGMRDDPEEAVASTRPDVMIVTWSWAVAVEQTHVRCTLETESAGWTRCRRWRSGRNQG